MEERDVELIVQSMNRLGLRITDQRKTIAQLFANATGFLSAKEVFLGMVDKYDGISFDTIYRNLRLLKELGVIEQFQIEDSYKYRVACFGHQHHHHHMICLSCNRVIPLESCPMDNFQAPDQFRIVKHRFEIYGYCDNCQQQGMGEDAETISA
ncbi:Fur family transcriptional regulator [Paenibacillus mendelii]|uniref:Fur family transcriptional regulator n=1 Tax=Paenibacillus mendelii TaxID=206163 RepID=A0ABV6J774_9BACL|nr:Fur family transcriptional regulator [Paenibacillus mendelii]MCQ6559918.1 transcriptional repressor [Paenibacillus mendelii]